MCLDNANLFFKRNICAQIMISLDKMAIDGADIVISNFGCTICALVKQIIVESALFGRNSC